MSRWYGLRARVLFISLFMINIHNYGRKLQKKVQSQLRAVLGNVLVPPNPYHHLLHGRVIRVWSRTRTLVKSYDHYIRNPSGVFFICNTSDNIKKGTIPDFQTLLTGPGLLVLQNICFGSKICRGKRRRCNCIFQTTRDWEHQKEDTVWPKYFQVISRKLR